PRKLTRGHHAAMPFDQVPPFMVELRAREAVAARALEWTIRTACRSDEALGATWGEIHGDVWIIPPERRKLARRLKGTEAWRAHRVPLTPALQALLEEMRKLRRTTSRDEPIFPGQRSGARLSYTSMEMLLRRMKADAWTVHGMRSAFKDW